MRIGRAGYKWRRMRAGRCGWERRLPPSYSGISTENIDHAPRCLPFIRKIIMRRRRGTFLDRALDEGVFDGVMEPLVIVTPALVLAVIPILRVDRPLPRQRRHSPHSPRLSPAQTPPPPAPARA